MPHSIDILDFFSESRRHTREECEAYRGFVYSYFRPVVSRWRVTWLAEGYILSYLLYLRLIEEGLLDEGERGLER